MSRKASLFVDFSRQRNNCNHGIILGDEAVVSKGPDRDIDREAVNILISLVHRVASKSFSMWQWTLSK